MSGKVIITRKGRPERRGLERATSRRTRASRRRVACCIANVVKRAQFNPPGGGGSTLNIPVTFVQQGK